MVTAVRTSSFGDAVDNALDYWKSIRQRLHHSPVDNYEVLPSGKKQSTPELYNPHTDDGDFLQRLASGMGIGWSEISKESVPIKLPDGKVIPSRDKNLTSDPAYLGFSYPFWGHIYDMANNTANELAWLFNSNKSIDPSLLNHKGKTFDLPKDTAYVPNRRDNFRFDRDLGRNVQDVKDDFASALGLALGRIGADFSNHGTRKYFWNLNPEDIIGTFSGKTFGHRKFLEELGLEPSNTLTGGIRIGAGLGLGLGVNNWNPYNLREGGRPAGFQAISADPDDPRKSTQPLVDILVGRGMLGRNGWLLPWEEFTQERPDVSYQDYMNYQEFLSRRNPGPIDRATMGVLKFDREGLDGHSPEARLLGYRVTPEGIVTAGIGAAIPIVIAKEMKDGTFSSLLGNAIRAIR